MKNKLKAIFLAVLDELKDPYYQAAAAELAFYLFLSILPMVTLFSRILGLFSLSLEDILSWANISIQQNAINTLSVYFGNGSSSGGISFILLIATIWAASRAQYSLIKVNNYALREEDTPKNFLVLERIRAYVFVICVIVLLVLTMVILIYLPSIFEIFFRASNIRLPFLLLTWLHWLLAFVLFFVVISVFYKWSPSKRLKFMDIVPGSLFASVCVVLATYLYFIYVRYSINTSLIYGSLSSVVLLLFWFFIIAWIICVGVIINKKCIELKPFITNEVSQYYYSGRSDTLIDRFAFRTIRPEESHELYLLEHSCFDENVADTEEAFTERGRLAPEHMMAAIDKKNGSFIGYVNGIVTDEECIRDEFFSDISCHNPDGKNVMGLGLGVLPEYRGMGIARELVMQYVAMERKRGKKKIFLTCHDDKIEMYKHMGFELAGKSGSSLGGEDWNEMYINL